MPRAEGRVLKLILSRFRQRSHKKLMDRGSRRAYYEY